MSESVALKGRLDGEYGIAEEHILTPDVIDTNGDEDVDVLSNRVAVVGPGYLHIIKVTPVSNSCYVTTLSC